MGMVAVRKRSELASSAKALPKNWRLSRNSDRSTPRKRATRRRNCGISDSSRRALPNRTAAARKGTRSRIIPKPSSKSSGSRLGLVEPADPHRLGHRIAQLGQIQILDGPSNGRLGFPAPVAVHALEEHPVMFLREHDSGGVADPSIGDAPILVGRRGTTTHVDDDDLAASRQPQALDLREDRRVDALYFASQLFERALADLLIHRSAIGRDPEHALPTPLDRCSRPCSAFATSRKRGFNGQELTQHFGEARSLSLRPVAAT